MLQPKRRLSPRNEKGRVIPSPATTIAKHHKTKAKIVPLYKTCSKNEARTPQYVKALVESKKSNKVVLHALVEVKKSKVHSFTIYGLECFFFFQIMSCASSNRLLFFFFVYFVRQTSSHPSSITRSV